MLHSFCHNPRFIRFDSYLVQKKRNKTFPEYYPSILITVSLAILSVQSQYSNSDVKRDIPFTLARTQYMIPCTLLCPFFIKEDVHDKMECKIRGRNM